MSTRLQPSLAKRFRSGRPCLDFAHTAATTEWLEPELIVDQESLQRWLGHVLTLEIAPAQEEEIARAHRLRAAILRAARERARGVVPAADDVRTINTFAGAPPPVPQLDADGGLARTPEVTVTAALSLLARDAVDLLAGPFGQRIRVCAAEDCAFLFVDASRPGTRRWCSMQRCGNLAKVRTHRGTTGSSPSPTGEVSSRE